MSFRLSHGTEDLSSGCTELDPRRDPPKRRNPAQPLPAYPATVAESCSPSGGGG